jgi:hypothetical protein
VVIDESGLRACLAKEWGLRDVQVIRPWIRPVGGLTCADHLVSASLRRAALTAAEVEAALPT